MRSCRFDVREGTVRIAISEAMADPPCATAHPEKTLVAVALAEYFLRKGTTKAS
jgi:hypothetical protein